MHARNLLSIVLIWSLWLPLASQAKTYELTPQDDWFAVLSGDALKPGDEVILGEGTYSDERRFTMAHRGTAEKPIVIRAADGAQAIITRPNADNNVLHLEGAQYLTLKGLEITGGSIGIRIGQGGGKPAKFITLDGNHIHHVGGVAVTANYPDTTYEGMHFLNNEIHHTSAEGEAFYLGSNNNEAQFFDGIIEHNYIHDLGGPGVKQGDGIEIKYGSYNNIVRDNVIHNTNFPGIIVYGAAGNGGPNLIERNAIWNAGDHGIQAASDAIIRNNIIFSTKGDGIHCRTHQGAIPGNLTIVNNVLSCDGLGIRVQSDKPLSGPVVIANNAMYPNGGQAFSLTKSDQYTILSNVGSGRANADLPDSAYSSTGSLEKDFVDFAGRNAFPKAGGALVGKAAAKHLPQDDYNQTPREDSLDVGAYKYQESGNPVGPIEPAFKPAPN